MFEQIRDFFSEYKNIAAKNITMQSSLVLDLGLTSYDIIEVCAYLEDMFSVEISEEILPNLSTVGDLVTYIEGYSSRP